MKKGSVILVILLCVLTTQGFSQLVIMAGGNGYLGQTGLMIGGGVELETGYGGCFGGSNIDDITTLGIGLEYLYLQTEFTQQPGGAFIIPFTIKKRFASRHNPFAFDVGIGTAMALIDSEREYNNEVYSDLGIAAYAEADVNYLLPSDIIFRAGLRGGILYINDTIYPFFGFKLYAGYLFPSDNQTEDETIY